MQVRIAPKNNQPGARGGTRTRTSKGQRILSPLRLPFRHPGSGRADYTGKRPINPAGPC